MNKIIINILVSLIILAGCQNSSNSIEKVKYLCSQAEAEQTAPPNKFKITPKQVIELASSYYLSNPFVLMLYYDDKYYYVDIATKSLSKTRAYQKGVKIDGITGKVLRGQVRTIGK